MTLAYLRAASRASASVLAPVHTILPELKMSAVVFGARMRMIAAANRCADESDPNHRRFSVGYRAVHRHRSSPLALPRCREGQVCSLGLGFTSHLWVVLDVAGVERDGLQVQLAVQVDGRHNIPVSARCTGQAAVGEGFDRAESPRSDQAGGVP